MAKFRKKKKPTSENNGVKDNCQPPAQVNTVSGKSEKPKKESDVDEGKTIFVRNLSFETTQEALRLFMSNIAPVEYCLLCKDKAADQSKGSAFVKFKKVEDADRVVNMDQEQLVLDGRKLNVDHALPRNVVQKHQENKDRDKRNLYLCREGLVYAGSPAAEGVSKIDLEKRLALEGKKRLLLQKLTNFISKTRLCVHNVPSDYDNAKLKKLFRECLGVDSGAKVVDCRIMRNRSATGKLGSNKGFAFVEFEKHEHALRALRKLNNNPEVFSDTRRPIVEFAIEDRLALNKRIRQRAKNEQAKNKKVEKKSSDANKIVDGKKDQVKKDVNQNANLVEIPKAPRIRKNKKKERESNILEEGAKGDHKTSFTGFIAEPLKACEPVVAPKLNRKLGEAKKLIAEKSRQKKFEGKKEKIKQEHLSKRQLKIARRKEAKALQTKNKIPKEFDDFEEKFVKKSGAKILVDDRNDHLDIPAKKAKWFRDD